MVEGSTYSRNHLKNRLYRAGLKAPRCELCGQGELWRGQPMSLILDHINGRRDDHRLENLRILCPNCAATLDTHCGRKNRLEASDRECLRCGSALQPELRATALLLPRMRHDARHDQIAGCRIPLSVASERPPTTSSCGRSPRRATRPSAASTASRTTRSASGCASTSARRRRRRIRSGRVDRRRLTTRVRRLSRSERTCRPARACRPRSSAPRRRACRRTSRRWRSIRRMSSSTGVASAFTPLA